MIHPPPLPAWKKCCIAALIALLTLTLYLLASPLFYFPESTPLPGEDSAVELYSKQTDDNLTNLFVQAIREAKDSITLAIYSLRDDQIINALKAKSNQGVPITLVYDSKATSNLSRRLPKVTFINYRGAALMHMKILVIDSKDIWLGSANMTYSSLNIHHNLIMKVENPALAKAISTRVRNMNKKGESLLHQKTKGGGQEIELWVLPDDSKAIERLKELLRQAKKTIKIAMFAWMRSDLAEELIEAKKKGIKVEVVIDSYSAKGGGKQIFNRLKEGGIDVRLGPKNKLMHHKFAYIDDTLLINGSANWTQAAFEKNADSFVILYPLFPRQQAKMHRVWNRVVKDSD